MSRYDLAARPLVDVARAKGLRAEFSRLWLATRVGWANGTRPWLGLSLALACVAVTLLLHVHTLHTELWRSGDVFAALPLSTELVRLPMSLFMPTAYLPLWGAILQLLVVIGLGELILGRSMTLLVAAAGHVVRPSSRAFFSTLRTFTFLVSPPRSRDCLIPVPLEPPRPWAPVYSWPCA